MPTASSTISLVAEFRNPVISREANGAIRIDCDLKIGRHQVVNGIAVGKAAEHLLNLNAPVWVHVRGFVLSILPPSRSRPMFQPVMHEPFCIEAIEALVSEPRESDLLLLTHDSRFGWMCESIRNVIDLGALRVRALS